MNGKSISLVALLVFITAAILPAQGQAKTALAPQAGTATPTATATSTATSTGTSLANCGLLTKLVSYWKLDEASGNAIDSVGANTLTAYNAPGSATGIVNGARTFSGNLQYFSIPTNPSVENGANDFTFTAWGLITDKSDYRTLVGKLTENDPIHIRDYSLSYDKGLDRIYFQVAGPDGFTLTRAIANSLGSPMTNTWYFLAGGYDFAQGNIWISVNGGAKETVPFSGAVHVGSPPFVLGGVDNPTFGYFAGRIDEVGYWKRTLSNSEIMSLYNSGAGLTYPFVGAGNCYTGTNHAAYLPVVENPLVGIEGHVTVNSAPAAGAFLELRRFNGQIYITQASTYTDQNGLYSFDQAPSLGPGENYYVRYRNTGGTLGRLWFWGTQNITSFTAGGGVAAGNFDLADISLVSPPNNSSLALPVLFQWTRRPATPSDSYQLTIYHLGDYNPFAQTGLLGYVNGLVIGSLPSSFHSGVAYAWEVWVNSPDGGYGISYGTRLVTFTNAGAVARSSNSATSQLSLVSPGPDVPLSTRHWGFGQ